MSYTVEHRCGICGLKELHGSSISPPTGWERLRITIGRGAMSIFDDDVCPACEKRLRDVFANIREPGSLAALVKT